MKSLRENRSKNESPKKFGRRNFLYLAGAATVAVISSIFLSTKKEIQKVTEKRTETANNSHNKDDDPMLSQFPELPEIPIPTITFQKRFSSIDQPQGLSISPAEFINISKKFTQKIKQKFEQDYLQGLLGIHSPQQSDQYASAFLAGIMNDLSALDPRIAEHIHISAKTSNDEMIDYLNTFLIPSGFCISREVYYLHQQGVSFVFLALSDVDRINDVHVSHMGEDLSTPVVYLKQRRGLDRSIFRGQFPTQGVLAEYHPDVDLIQINEEETDAYFENKFQQLMYDEIGRKLLAKEPMSGDYLKVLREGILKHEAIHALLHRRFPHLYRNERSTAEMSAFVSLDVPFSNFRWKVNKAFPIENFEEMAACGADLHLSPRYGAFKLFEYFFSYGQSLFLFHQFFLRAIPSLSHLPEALRSKILHQVINESGPIEIKDIAEIIADPAVDTEQVNALGKKLWDIGYELSRQANKYLGKND